MRSPVHYGWVILAVAILGNTVVAGGTWWVVTVYVPAISDDFGVPRFPIVAAFMAGQAISAVLGPIAGRYVDGRGARRALLAGSVVVPAAMLLTAASTEVWHLFVGWGLVSAGRALLMPIPYNWLLTRWFQRRRQAALGVVTVGFGLGGAALLPLLAAVEARSGWAASMVVSAVLILVVNGTAVLLLVRDRPADLGLRPEGAAEDGEASSADEEGGFTAAEAMRTSVFWLLSLGMMLFFVGQGSVGTLTVDFFRSRGVAGGATIVAVGALLRTVARVPLGLSLARMPRVFWLAIGVSVSQALAVVALLALGTGHGLGVYIALWGIGGAFAPMLEPLLVTRIFGVRHFGAVSGVVAMVAFGGQVLGPLGGAALFDATGSYTVPFSIYAGGFIVAAVLFAGAAAAVRSRVHHAAAVRAGMGAGAPDGPDSG